MLSSGDQSAWFALLISHRANLVGFDLQQAFLYLVDVVVHQIHIREVPNPRGVRWGSDLLSLMVVGRNKDRSLAPRALLRSTYRQGTDSTTS